MGLLEKHPGRNIGDIKDNLPVELSDYVYLTKNGKDWVMRRYPHRWKRGTFNSLVLGLLRLIVSIRRLLTELFADLQSLSLHLKQIKGQEGRGRFCECLLCKVLNNLIAD
jgi:hypothetical protein